MCRSASVKWPCATGNESETAWADMVSGNFFSGLGVPLERGRGFTIEDETGRSQAAVISYAYWTRRFGRRPDAVGSTLYVKGVPFTIIGITAQPFVGLGRGRRPTSGCRFRHGPSSSRGAVA